MWRIYHQKFTDIHLAISQLGPYIVVCFNKVIQQAHESFSSPFQTVGGLREPLLYLHTYTCVPYNLHIS